jgi:hypothetical protein
MKLFVWLENAKANYITVHNHKVIEKSSMFTTIHSFSENLLRKTYEILRNSKHCHIMFRFREK